MVLITAYLFFSINLNINASEGIKYHIWHLQSGYYAVSPSVLLAAPSPTETC